MNFESIVNIAKNNEVLLEIQKQTGGMIWNSGGGCMILSILLQDSVVNISYEYICEYIAKRNCMESVSIDDLIDMDEEKTVCINATKW